MCQEIGTDSARMGLVGKKTKAEPKNVRLNIVCLLFAGGKSDISNFLK